MTIAVGASEADAEEAKPRASHDRDIHQPEVVGVDRISAHVPNGLPRRSRTTMPTAGKSSPGERRILHAGYLAGLLNKAGIERARGFRRIVSAARAQIDEEAMCGGEARVYVLNLVESAQQQPCRNQECER
ncbi:MAG: hypothetical protein WDO73_13100 [Ignavibacteriota bacterium]